MSFEMDAPVCVLSVMEEIYLHRKVQLRRKAVFAALAMTSGAYSTGLISYFTHRDLFPSLMKVTDPDLLLSQDSHNLNQFVQDSETTAQCLEPFALLGLLANYNKFEFQNPYKVRLDDFVNESVIKKIVLCIGATCALARDKYVAIQDDLPDEWSLGSTLAIVGLGSLVPGRKPTAPVLTSEEAKVKFTALYDTPNPYHNNSLSIVTDLGLKLAFSSQPTTLRMRISSSVSIL